MPRVGNSVWASAFNSYIPNSQRMVRGIIGGIELLLTGWLQVHGADIVPHVPPLDILGYMHVSTQIWELSANITGPPTRYIVCVGNEDPTCSDSIVGALIFLLERDT